MKPSQVLDCEGPIDRTALLQMIRGPECNIEQLPEDAFRGFNAVQWSDDPLPLRPIPKHFRIQDFTGTKRGKGSVVGYWGSIKRASSSPKNRKRKGGYRHYFVIKCECGGYQLIRLQTLKAEAREWMCHRCSWLRDIRRGYGTYFAEHRNQNR